VIKTVTNETAHLYEILLNNNENCLGQKTGILNEVKIVSKVVGKKKSMPQLTECENHASIF